MTRTLELLRRERAARWFFAALAQSALGTGAAYIALLVVAYDRFDSAWAISLVLLADLVPAMLLGPVFGAAADRWSRRGCMVLADVLRAAAFVGIALVDGFGITIALAVVAGVGTGLFTPPALAALPGLVKRERLPAATALYGAVADIGFIGGPAIAAGLLLVIGPETILVANGITFAISALLLGRLSFGAAPAVEDGVGAKRPGLLREARDGLGALMHMAGIRVVVFGSGAMLLFAGLFNVAELPFAKGPLDAGESGFALLATIYGIGFVGGSLSGGRGGDHAVLSRRFLAGLAVVAAGFLACGAAPNLAVACLAFGLAGVGNGLVLVYERLLIQTTVPDRLMARIFGVKDALTAWGFAVAFLVAGGLVEAWGARTLILVAGAGGVLVWLGCMIALALAGRGATEPAGAGREPLSRLGGRARAAGEGAAGQHGPDLVGGRGPEGIAVLDDSSQR
jgi:MFS family permease